MVSQPSNPLLSTSPLPFAAVPFDQIQGEHFVPAIDWTMAEARAAVAALKDQTQPPTFANTLHALETATARVYDVAYVYTSLRSANGDQKLQALAKEIMPKLVELESDINLDEVLFARVEAAIAAMGPTGGSQHTVEEWTLADRTRRQFRRNGAQLSADDKKRLRAIDEELSTLGPEFSDHVLKATNGYQMVITEPKDLAGLPPSACEGAAQRARERGVAVGWVFTLEAPSALAFLRYSEVRHLRQQLWMAQGSRAVSGPNSNAELVRKIARLRHTRAALLGFQSHAHFQMDERMAERPETVKAFLDRLADKARPAALREVAELTAYAAQHGQAEPLMPWDYSYWSTKLKEERFAVSAEVLRPYFRLDAVLEGAFAMAGRLYDLSFTETSEVPTYDKDGRVFRVDQKVTGEFMGLLYVDFFPRSTKAGGAWCTRFRSQWREGTKSVRPHVSIVCNFTRPSGGEPSLLTYQEVTTLFHEFGHALHSLLSQCAFRSLSCTSVYRDFVELPSQIMENWVREPEGLALFARHFQTGAPIPADLVAKLVASDQFHAAFALMRQLRFAYLDLAWYSGDPGAAVDVDDFEGRAVAPTDLLPNVAGTNISCSFEHIFSGGYSAGYYGYKWAEVLDADAFELFKEKGIFAREVADRFRKSILERGGSEHPMRLYKEFRGRAPDPDALLRRSQLL